MTAETNIAAIGTGQPNTALEVRTALTSVLGRAVGLDPGIKPPATPGVGDIEFTTYGNGTDPTAAPGLTWANQGTSTAAVKSGYLVMTSQATNHARGLVKATPGAGNFTISTRWESWGFVAVNGAGLLFIWGTPAAPTAVEYCGAYYDSGAVGKIVWTQANTSWVPTLDRAFYSTAAAVGTVYYATVEWNGTSLLYRLSPSGTQDTYRLIYTATLGLGRPNYVGVFVNAGGATAPSIASFSFLRFGWSGSDFDPTT